MTRPAKKDDGDRRVQGETPSREGWGGVTARRPPGGSEKGPFQLSLSVLVAGQAVVFLTRSGPMQKGNRAAHGVPSGVQ